MDKKEIFDKVSSIVADHFDIDRAKITEDLNLKTDLDADSIDFVEFVLEVEDTFGAEIEDSEAEKLSTIGEVVDYIAAHQQDKKISKITGTAMKHYFVGGLFFNGNYTKGSFSH